MPNWCRNTLSFPDEGACAEARALFGEGGKFEGAFFARDISWEADHVWFETRWEPPVKALEALSRELGANLDLSFYVESNGGGKATITPEGGYVESGFSSIYDEVEDFDEDDVPDDVRHPTDDEMQRIEQWCSANSDDDDVAYDGLEVPF